MMGGAYLATSPPTLNLGPLRKLCVPSPLRSRASASNGMGLGHLLAGRELPCWTRRSASVLLSA
jgi:hypothetical protein